MRLQRNTNLDQINQNTQHKLFVEGKDNQAIDPIVIQELLKHNGLNAIEVQAMGECDNVRNAAQALIYQHSTYYFLIDRDDQELEKVEKSWESFPDINTHNLLVWHNRELENYFLNPEYICKSTYLKPNIDIKKRILDECNLRIFLDAANLTIYKINRELQQEPFKTIRHFTDLTSFANKMNGENQLLEAFFTGDRINSLAGILGVENIKEIYSNFVEELSGGVFPLEYGAGNWLERMSGKEVFHIISNQCFEVKDASGNLLHGKEKNKQIAKQLVKLPIHEQPQDFQKLVEVLRNRIR